jgi:hypothetical protein
VASRGAGIAVFHRFILRQTFETRKGLILGPSRFVARIRTFETRGLALRATPNALCRNLPYSRRRGPESERVKASHTAHTEGEHAKSCWKHTIEQPIIAAPSRKRVRAAHAPVSKPTLSMYPCRAPLAKVLEVRIGAVCDQKVRNFLLGGPRRVTDSEVKGAFCRCWRWHLDRRG